MVRIKKEEPVKRKKTKKEKKAEKRRVYTRNYRYYD